MKNPFRRERIAGIQQFITENPKTKERTPHIYVFTNKRVIELDYETQKEIRAVVTLKQLKSVKATEE